MTTANNSNEIGEERDLQAAIYDDPSILDEAWPEGNRPRWVFICREKSIPVDSIPQHDLSLDLLFVGEDARPTLVETKLSSNIEIRRTIVGQLLEYAAHVKNCNVDELRRDYEYPDDARLRVLADIRSLETYASADDFWQQLRENLDNGRMTLLFAADDFPQETQTTAAFLDAMTKDNLNVRACAPSGINLSSTRPSRPAQQQPSTNKDVHSTINADTSRMPAALSPQEETFRLADLPYVKSPKAGYMTAEKLYSHLTPLARSAMLRLVKAAYDSDAQFEAEKYSLVINAKTDLWHRPIKLIWLDPPAPQSRRNSYGVPGTFTFGYGGGIFNQREPGPDLLASLRRWNSLFEGRQYERRPGDAIHNRQWMLSYDQVIRDLAILCDHLVETIDNLRTLDSHNQCP